MRPVCCKGYFQRSSHSVVCVYVPSNHEGPVICVYGGVVWMRTGFETVSWTGVDRALPLSRL